MVARRRLTSSPSSDSTQEDCVDNHTMAVLDIPRRVPLQVESSAMTSDDDEIGIMFDQQQHTDPYRQQHEQQHEEWESPGRHPSGSSSSSSSYNASPARATQQVIDVPNSAPSAFTRCIESQSANQRNRRETYFQSTSSSSSSSLPSPFMMGLVFIGLVATILSRNSVSYAVQKASELATTRDNLSHKLYKTESDLQSLKREMMAMNALIQQQQEVDSNASPLEANRQLAMHELNALQSRIKELNHKGTSLKDRVQQISRQEMHSKYGVSGSKYVEMELVFLDGTEGPTKFTIELAATEMPHSVHTFLEMVTAHLLDGCSFILNALHVLKAAPLPYDGSLAAAKAKAFAAHGLESVAFKEYSDSYPHRKYTVGFAADGSPSFYINTADNTDVHVGDPCFGRIVDGFNTVHRLESAPTRNGIWFAKKIGIKRATILPDDYVPKVRAGLRQSSNSQD